MPDTAKQPDPIRRGSYAEPSAEFPERGNGGAPKIDRYSASREQLRDMLAAAEYQAAKLKVECAGWRRELQDLADVIPTDRSAGDSPLMQALAQAHLVLREGLQ